MSLDPARASMARKPADGAAPDVRRGLRPRKHRRRAMSRGGRAQRREPSVSSDTAPRGADVRFPFPPLLFAGPLAATLALHRALPLRLPAGATTSRAGAVLTVAGGLVSLSGAATALLHRTTVVPHHQVSTLLTNGPFRFSRNPMYTGLAVSYVGAALWAGSWWPLLVAPLPIRATDRLVIAHEEDYLTACFGDQYHSYRNRVRRWL